jgi:hypothetical protein
MSIKISRKEGLSSIVKKLLELSYEKSEIIKAMPLTIDDQSIEFIMAVGM